MLSILFKIKIFESYVNRRAMRFIVLFSRLFSWLFTFCVFFISAAVASVPPTAKVIRVESFNQLKVGDSIDSLVELSQEKSRWGAPRHIAKNYFYLLRSDLPSRCLNLQCGRFARKIMMKNGFLVGGADQVLAKEVGLDFVSTDANSARSLLIVTDASGKVTHLFENVVPGSMDEILEQVSVR